MKIVLLAATQREAHEHARDAGLQPRSRDIIAPGTVQSIAGLTLTEEDLIMEFPGFRDRPDAQHIIESLHISIRHAKGAGPVWRQAGKVDASA